ncbi:hypothetical protein Leryth_022958 [Lithospermum erythrorhizon]|nr:hypothetical protein Leryth_022958 [Lithospermum erythrorhizon]
MLLMRKGINCSWMKIKKKRRDQLEMTFVSFLLNYFKLVQLTFSFEIEFVRGSR